ncbi:hypothetical protein [Demequina mangrovi]|uniref:Uncharacterized protein n=1 Tax=Demequina mangrovi TaxID=1043493 RepID=A0A1H6WEQ6_9MICO|nr:hypothetical protein [Demequina mangrovi]SEJ11300.1 hypothetical protein SAMN05421637_0819 [Demequina mangrovi]
MTDHEETTEPEAPATEEVPAPAPPAPPHAEAPTLSPRTRTRIYVVGLAVSFLTYSVSGIAAIFMDDPQKVVGVSAIIATAFGAFASGVGVAYRPTR